MREERGKSGEKTREASIARSKYLARRARLVIDRALKVSRSFYVARVLP